ncbi:GbsR/MarR family transcriptional regulator [Paenibacillus flagellatus]|uniref:HTH-type transcriptional regulator n=1 Tax=Paenibacillus flagellatus TaxID=2211139 RepID=A0A2V5JUH5_9BACL|nr:hypothetical protein [Paenibacillus flagellatus]PYI50239.1 hypothetical protein DLM86_30365 [Paenibacillus flagellatus]
MGSAEFDSFLAKLTEKMARMFQEAGSSPLVGRIYALLICSPEPVSLQDMSEKLGVTKAAVSIQVRLLESYGLCAKLARGKDRKDYYCIPDDHLQVTMGNVRQRLNTECESIEDTLNNIPKRDGLTPEERVMLTVLEQRYTEMLAFYRIMFRRLEGIEEETGRLIAEMREKRGKPES